MERGVWKWIKIGQEGPLLSHLFFANDWSLFMQDSQDSLAILKEIIHDYENVLGQKINIHKSFVFFSLDWPGTDGK